MERDWARDAVGGERVTARKKVSKSRRRPRGFDFPRMLARRVDVCTGAHARGVEACREVCGKYKLQLRLQLILRPVPHTVRM